MNEAREKLAEAMGYVKVSNYTGSFADQQGVQHWTHPDGYAVFEAPDPYTDANDDYAVLEWCRINLSPKQFVKFSENIANLLIGLEKKKPFDALCISLTTEYQIGFYARATCDVLGIPLLSESY